MSVRKATILVGDVRDGLRTLPAESVQAVCTSPPYWALRDYGVAGQIGLEPTPEAWVAAMVEVFREVRRVLRSDGVCWVNVGDSYATSAGKVGACTGGGSQGAAWAERGVMTPPNRMRIDGYKPKDLVGQPWMLAFALRADGWWLRSDCIWSKPNPMPESVTDRPTKAHEYVFMFTKAARYFYDAEAGREEASPESEARYGYSFGGAKNESLIAADKSGAMGVRTRVSGEREYSGKRNARTVWTIPSHPFPDAHFATFPPALVEKCLAPSVSERGACPNCGAAWERVVERQKYGDWNPRDGADTRVNTQRARAVPPDEWVAPKTTGWRPRCTCPPAEPVGCRVLDPFSGAGTTGLVALRRGCEYVGCELNPTYVEMSRARIVSDAPLLNRVTVWTVEMRAIT